MMELNKIYCGDCLDFMREMPDKSVDLVLTDPPYGIGENHKKNNSRANPTYKWRDAHPTDYGEYNWDESAPSKEYFNEIFRVSKDQIIFGGNYFNLPPTSCWIIWDKKSLCDYADAELAWTSFKSAVRIFRWMWCGFRQEDIEHKEKRDHPTQKPLPLMMWCLEKYSKEGMTVLDPFMGSGTTCVACVKTGRNYIGIDKEPTYVEIARKRLEKVNNTKLSEWF